MKEIKNLETFAFIINYLYNFTNILKISIILEYNVKNLERLPVET